MFGVNVPLASDEELGSGRVSRTNAQVQVNKNMPLFLQREKKRGVSAIAEWRRISRLRSKRRKSCGEMWNNAKPSRMITAEKVKHELRGPHV